MNKTVKTLFLTLLITALGFSPQMTSSLQAESKGRALGHDKIKVEKVKKEKKEKKRDDIPTAPEWPATMMLLLGLGAAAWISLSRQPRTS